MKFKQGVMQTLEKKQRIWSNRIKHFGEPRVITVGISNFCSDFKWHLFYDMDYEIERTSRAYITAQIGNNLLIIKTKHGYQLMDMKCNTLEQIKYYFDFLKFEFPSDYFWSTPLFLRISEKVDENGNILSPAPENPMLTDIFKKEILLNHFLDRKLYRTWD